jgi:hypothetical protein
MKSSVVIVEMAFFAGLEEKAWGCDDCDGRDGCEWLMNMLMIGDLPGERKMVEDGGIQVHRRKERKRQRCSGAWISSF